MNAESIRENFVDEADIVKTKDLSFGDPENFPIDAFPESIRLLATELSDIHQTPVCMPAMCALGVLSGSIGKSIIVKGAYKDRDTFLNLYIVPVAERGSGKGVIGELLCKPLNERSRELTNKTKRLNDLKRVDIINITKEIAKLSKQPTSSNPTQAASDNDHLNELQINLQQLESEVKTERTLLGNNATSESVAKILAENDETLFIFSSEGGGAMEVALGAYKKEGKADLELLLSGYSGDFVKYNRISRPPIELLNPRLALLLSVQPVILRDLANNIGAISRGLTARMLIFKSGAKRQKDDRRNLEFTYGEAWRCLIDPILEYRLSNIDPRILLCSPAAREIFADFHDESVAFEEEDFPDLKGEASRWRENTIKVAGIFTIAAGITTITAECARAAVLLVRWCAYSYFNSLKDNRKERNLEEFEKLERYLEDNGGSMNLGELHRHHSFDRDRVEALLAVFPSKLKLERRQQDGKPGRPSEVVTLINKST